MEWMEEMKKDGFEGYKPDEDPQIRGDAYKTLFVGRLSYEAKESDLEREFGRFGPIERVRFLSVSPSGCVGIRFANVMVVVVVMMMI